MCVWMCQLQQERREAELRVKREDEERKRREEKRRQQEEQKRREEEELYRRKREQVHNYQNVHCLHHHVKHMYSNIKRY